eukprot:CFRG3844T1
MAARSDNGSDLMDIGTHCNLTSCHALDFLPFKCHLCHGSFCKDHQSTSNHSCPDENEAKKIFCAICGSNLPLSDTHGEEAVKAIHERNGSCLPERPVRYVCNVSGCRETGAYIVPCSECKIHHCLKHRHTDDHSCAAIKLNERCIALQKENETVVQKAFCANSTGQSAAHPVVKKDAKKPMSAAATKTALKVQLMKLKMTAKAGASVPPESRVYLKVERPEESVNRNPILVYFDKNWSVGRALDQIAILANVKNVNNESTTKRLMLFHADTRELLEISSKLNDAVTNGQSILLERVDVVKN